MLTFSNLKRESAGSEFKVWGTVAFDSSYSFGGEAFNALEIGLKKVNRIKLQPEKGYNFSPEYTTEKITNIKVFGSGKPTGDIVLDSIVAAVTTVSSNTCIVGTVSFAIVECVYVTAGIVTGPFVIIPNNAFVSLASGRVAVNHSLHTLNFFPGDGVTQCQCTYISRTKASLNAGGAIFTGDYNNIGNEIANLTNLSTLSAVEFEAYGY